MEGEIGKLQRFVCGGGCWQPGGAREAKLADNSTRAPNSLQNATQTIAPQALRTGTSGQYGHAGQGLSWLIRTPVVRWGAFVRM